MTTPPIFDLGTDVLPMGISLLEASAGTGKTWTVTHLVLRELLGFDREVPLEPEQVLLVTFTNAAADELAERLRRLMAEALYVAEGGTSADVSLPGLLAMGRQRLGSDQRLRLRLAVLTDAGDRFAVSTIHGWCNRILDSLTREAGAAPEATFITDVAAIRSAVVRDAWRQRIYPDPLLALIARGVAKLGGWCASKQADLVKTWMARPGMNLDPAPDPQGKGLAAALADCHVSLEKHLKKSVGDSVERFAAALLKALEVDAGGIRAAVDAVTIAWQAWLLPWAAAEISRRLALAGSRSPDSILATLGAALAGPQRAALVAALRQRHRLVMVDEFQDTDPLQWQIMASAFATGDHHRLVLVGDPKQAIYRFRGGDLPTYLAAAEQAAARWRLGTNFRSHPDVLGAVQALFAGKLPFAAAEPAADASTAKHDADTLNGDSGPALRWWTPAIDYGNKPKAEAAIADAIAAELHRLRQVGVTWRGRPIAWQDVAILVRTNNQAKLVRQVLRRHGITAVLQNAGDLLSTEAVADLRLVLAAIADLGDRRLRRRALATRIAGWTAALLGDGDPARDQALADHVAKLQRRWRQRGVVACIEALLTSPMPPHDQPPLVRLAGGADGERWVTDLRHAQDWIARQHQDLPMDPAAVAAALSGNAKDDAEDEERRLHLERDDDAVRLVTMHSAKGLEWPVVFAPFLWNAFPKLPEQPVVDGQDGSRRTLYLGGLPAGQNLEAVVQQQRLAEDLRLTYVALTRAKARCYVAWGAFGSAAKEPSASGLGWLLSARPADGDAAGWWNKQPGWKPNQRHVVLIAAVGKLPAHARGTWSAQPAVRPPSNPDHIDVPAVTVLPLSPGACRTWTTTSFTAMTRGSHGPPTADDDAAPQREPGDDLARIARGPGPGVAMHAILEAQDWKAPADPVAVAKLLAKHGLEHPARHGGADPVATISRLIDHLSGMDLGGFCLSGMGQQRREWRFELPLRQLRPREVSALFLRHGSETLRASAAGLAQLSAQDLRGFLTGSIDLLAEAPDGWRVVDWKSNWLAPTAAGYDQGTCRAAMRDHCYDLQAVLYALAVRRWLRRRGDHRSPRIAYIFLRGPAVVALDPPPPLLDALEACLESPTLDGVAT